MVSVSIPQLRRYVTVREPIEKQYPWLDWYIAAPDELIVWLFCKVELRSATITTDEIEMLYLLDRLGGWALKPNCPHDNLHPKRYIEMASLHRIIQRGRIWATTRPYIRHQLTHTLLLDVPSKTIWSQNYIENMHLPYSDILSLKARDYITPNHVARLSPRGQKRMANLIEEASPLAFICAYIPEGWKHDGDYVISHIGYRYPIAVAGTLVYDDSLAYGDYFNLLYRDLDEVLDDLSVLGGNQCEV